MLVFRRCIGVLLLALAALKVAGLVSILVQGGTDHTSTWMLKQTVYAVAGLVLGVSLLASGKIDNSNTERDDVPTEELE